MDSQSLKSLFQKPEFGLLVIRAGLGCLLAVYGFRKFAGGEDVLRAVGSAVNNVGLQVSSDSLLALLFGIAAASAEFFGGILIVVGFFFRPAVFLALTTLAVAFTGKLLSGGGIGEFGHPLVYVIVLLGLLFTGPGRISIQKD